MTHLLTTTTTTAAFTYQVRETFLPGRRATILYSPAKGGGWSSIGCFGVVHPEVLVKEKYDIEFPCSIVEMNLEPFV